MAHNSTGARHAASASVTSLLVLAGLVLAFAGALAAAQPMTQPGQVQLYTQWHRSVNTSSPHSDYYPRYNLLSTLAAETWLCLSVGCSACTAPVRLLR